MIFSFGRIILYNKNKLLGKNIIIIIINKINKIGY
jgi:hypothetical protein